jgi:hypothetical protein
VCELALIDSDHAGALRFGLPPPRGTATPAEAADGSVLRQTAAAAMQLGEVALAQELAGRLPGSFDRAILAAQLLHQAGHGDQARAAYERAWPLAETVVDQRDVQLGLAELGVWPLPGREELERDPDEFAVYILAQGEAARGDIAAAVRRLRPWQARSPHCAELLAHLHETAGEIDEAVAALEDTGLRTGTPRLLVAAAEVLFVHERDADLERLAARALAHTREGTNERLRLRLLLVAAAQRRQAWPFMAERARALLEEDPADPQARWLLVTALYNQRLAEQAWRVLSEGDDLVPRTPGEALAWVQLHGRFQPGIVWFQAALELAAEHGGQEQECAGILAELSQIRLNPAPPAELGARLQAAREAFVARYPASLWLWMLPVGTTAAEHAEALRPLLQPEAAARATAIEQVIAGRAPYGVLAVIARQPYALALLSCAAGCLPCYPAEAAVADIERAAARAALDGHPVTDASVLHLASHLQDRAGRSCAAVSPAWGCLSWQPRISRTPRRRCSAPRTE